MQNTVKGWMAFSRLGGFLAYGGCYGYHIEDWEFLIDTDTAPVITKSRRRILGAVRKFNAKMRECEDKTVGRLLQVKPEKVEITITRKG